MASPFFTVPLFIASLYGIYFTPLFDALMSSPVGHQVMLAHFVVAGLLFFGPIVAQDPWPRTLSHPARMLELFLPVPFHAFFGVAIMMAGSLVVTTFAKPPAGWGIDPLADQGEAGGIVWAFGELPTVLVLAVVFFSWASSEERRAGRSTAPPTVRRTRNWPPTTPACGPWPSGSRTRACLTDLDRPGRQAEVRVEGSDCGL